MIEKSETGWLILCDTCAAQTATVQEDGQFFCRQCFEGGDEEIEIDEEAELDVVCDCGARKCGLPCSDWCSTNE